MGRACHVLGTAMTPSPAAGTCRITCTSSSQPVVGGIATTEARAGPRGAQNKAMKAVTEYCSAAYATTERTSTAIMTGSR